MSPTKVTLLGASLFIALGVAGQQSKNERKSAAKPPSAAAGQETFKSIALPGKDCQRRRGSFSRL